MQWSVVGNWLVNFATKHEEALGLFFLAMAVTMRPKLPWPFVLIEPLEWLYEWTRDGLLTFVSMRGPAHQETSGQQTLRVTDPSGKVVESSTQNEAASSLVGEENQESGKK